MERRHAVRGVLPATFVSAALIAHLVAAKAARDALFLTCFDVALLPRMLMSGAAVSLGAAFVAALVMNRKSPASLLVGALVTSTVLYGVECALLARFAPAVAVMLYLHVAAFGATLVAALWSLVNEWFDPRTAKREVRRIALGGSLGGVLGGIMSWVVSGTHGLTVLLSLLGGLNILALCAVLPLTGQRARAYTKSLRTPNTRGSSVKTIKESPYLLALAALVALSAFSSALLEYVLGAQAVRNFPETAALTAFYASFHAGVGVLGLLVQFTLTRPILDRFGLAGSVALLPCAVLGSGLLALVSPALWSAALLRGSEAVVQASVFRSGYELFYTPLPPAQKRPTKMLIDVGVDRLGTMCGGGLAALLVPIAQARVQTVLLVLAMGAATAALWCALRLHRGYVDALASRLRRGTLHLDPSRVFDATTQRTLAESVSLDRGQILAAIAQQRSEHPERPSSPPEREHELAPALLMTSSGAGFEAAPGYVGLHLDDEDTPNARDERRDVLLERATVLRSGEVARIRAELAQPLTPELVWCALPLLAHDQLARDVLPALREVAPRAVGAMADVLLDPSSSPVLRRRVPRVLENCPTPRAIRVLVDGLFDVELSVRHQCALALLRVAELTPAARLPRERLLDAIEDELAQDRSAPAARRRERDALDDRPEFGEHAIHERAHRGVEYVMTLLALVLDREPLRLAYHGLYAGSAAIRGTALEYLDSVLPSRVKQGVLALLEATPEPPLGARRDAAALADELLRSREFVLPSALGGPRK